MFLLVLVPVYNEEEVLSEFYHRLDLVLNSLSLPSQILFVNDGSTDGTLNLIQTFAESDPRIAYINLSRNFGKEAAMSAGLDHADADAVIIIDADLQDPPEVIPQMVHWWQQGYDVIYGQRAERRGETLLKRWTAASFYRLMQRAGRFTIPPDTGDFRLLSARAINALRQLPESNRFMKGLFAWIGFNQKALVYNRDPRTQGYSKFNYWKLWNFALDGITSFTTLPLRLASYIGFFLSFGSLIYGAFIIVKTIFFGNPVHGYPSLLTVILFLGGIQLLFLGILGEYLGRMFDETKRRPIYLIERFHQANQFGELKKTKDRGIMPKLR